MAREWKIIPESEVGINLVSLHDTETGITVNTPVAKMGGKIEAKTAWAAGRFSRSADSVKDILAEMHRSGANAEAKLADFAIKYGHASLADMALPMIYIEGIPIHLAAAYFYRSAVGGGQERSTRFQDFSESHLPNATLTPKLKKQYEELGQYSVETYLKWTQRLTEKYTEFYKPDQSSKKDQAALAARVFDSSRGFLLAGLDTSFAYRTSAREWSRLVALGKEGRLKVDQLLADQIEELLSPKESIPNYTPEVSSLVRHTEANKTCSEKLQQLDTFFKKSFGLKLFIELDKNYGKKVDQSVRVLPKEITVGEKMAVQYFLSLYPNISFDWGLRLIRSLSDEQKTTLSQLIFKNQSHLNLMGNQAEVTGITSEITMALSEARDLNRHRGQGRFASFFEMRESYNKLFDKGYVLPLYLSKITEFNEEKKGFIHDMEAYFERLRKFTDGFAREYGESGDNSVLLNLFPLAGAITYFMHANPKQAVYMTSLRERPGGHINYRDIAWLMAEEISDAEPLFSGILLQSIRPNPASRDEFFNRG